MSIQSSAPANYGSSKFVDQLMRGLVVVATSLAIIPLFLIIGYVVFVGGSSMSVEFFTQSYQPPLAAGGDLGIDIDSFLNEGAPADPNAVVDPNATTDPFAGVDIGGAIEGGAAGEPEASDLSQVEAQGGILHGIVGTMLIAGMALLISLPIGILAGVFLSEYPSNPVANVVRFCSDVLSGAPSIIVGVVAYVLIVRRLGVDGRPFGFAGIAGSIALAFLMVPTIVRTTEEILRLVPESMREAALAMGAPTWYSTFTVVIPTALTGIVTGVLLAFARGAGETAPLLLTVLGANQVVTNLLEPMAALPLLTYRYTESPFPSENVLAWGTAFVLMMMVLIVNILVRLATRSRVRGR